MCKVRQGIIRDDHLQRFAESGQIWKIWLFSKKNQLWIRRSQNVQNAFDEWKVLLVIYLDWYTCRIICLAGVHSNLNDGFDSFPGALVSLLSIKMTADLKKLSNLTRHDLYLDLMSPELDNIWHQLYQVEYHLPSTTCQVPPAKYHLPSTTLVPLVQYSSGTYQAWRCRGGVKWQYEHETWNRSRFNTNNIDQLFGRDLWDHYNRAYEILLKKLEGKINNYDIQNLFQMEDGVNAEYKGYETLIYMSEPEYDYQFNNEDPYNVHPLPILLLALAYHFPMPGMVHSIS